MGHIFILLASVAIGTFQVISANQAVGSFGQCYSFSEGQVYPQERRETFGHGLHTSKTQISQPAPFWEGTAIVNSEFRELNLTQFSGKYLVFFFYPLDFTFVCPTEIIAFSDRVGEFKAIDTEVVAASVDSPFTHLAWIKTPRKQGGLGPINIPLLSDLSHKSPKTTVFSWRIWATHYVASSSLIQKEFCDKSR